MARASEYVPSFLICERSSLWKMATKLCTSLLMAVERQSNHYIAGRLAWRAIPPHHLTAAAVVWGVEQRETKGECILAARIPYDSLVVVDEKLHAAIVVFGKVLGHRVGSNVGRGNEETIAEVVVVLRLWCIDLAKYCFDAIGMKTIGSDDQIALDDVAIGESDGRGFGILSWM